MTPFGFHLARFGELEFPTGIGLCNPKSSLGKVGIVTETAKTPTFRKIQNPKWCNRQEVKHKTKSHFWLSSSSGQKLFRLTGMENKPISQHLSSNGNGKQPQPLAPVNETSLQQNDAEELNLREFLILARRRGILIASVAIAVTAAVCFSTLNSSPKYEGKFRLLVEPVTAESKLAGLTQAPGINGSLQQSGLDYETQIQVLQSPQLMGPLIEQLQTRYSDITYDSLIRKLNLVRLEQTKILEVRYQDSEPQKIQFILEQLAQTYLKYSLQERQTNLRQGIQFVEDQLPQLQERVDSLQAQLQKFRQQYNFIDPELRATQLSQQVSTIEQQRIDTQKELAETRALYATLQERAGAASALNQSPVYQKLLSQLRDVESQIASESVRFRPDSPVIVALRRQRDNLLPLLRGEAKRVLGNKLAEVANQIGILEIRALAIASAEIRFNQQVKQLPALARQYADLQRELKVATESLNRFLEKREALQVEAAQKEIPWQVIAAPKPPKEPISPDVQRNIFFGAIAGLLAGIGVALLAERLDNVFHSADHLKDKTKLPLLGMIPFHKNLKYVAPVAEAPVLTKQNNNLVFRNISPERGYINFPFLEAFRSLYTNIRFLGSDTPINSLVISSAIQGDGKSTVAVNLALCAASMGQRVLLVDADLRLPQIHNMLGLPNLEGLSNVISTELAIEDVIVRSPLADNLFVLTSGQIPPDPTKLLSSNKMQHIMEQLRSSFDLVIYDTPPILGLADSSILGTYTAGIVLVVRLGKTDRSVLMQALDGLKISRANVLGTVANGSKYHTYNSYNYYYRSNPHSMRKK